MQSINLAYRNLADAIILQAVTDYRNALKGISYNPNYTPRGIIREVENFFRSDYFEMLTRIKGEYLIDQIRKEQSGCENES